MKQTQSRAKNKKLIDNGLSYIVTINDLSDITLSEILEKSGNTEEQYNNALEFVEKQVPIVYKGKRMKLTWDLIILLL